MGQIGFKKWIFRYETGKIQGSIDDEDEEKGNARFGTFDNDYKLAILYQKEAMDSQGFRLGVSFIQYVICK